MKKLLLSLFLATLFFRPIHSFSQVPQRGSTIQNAATATGNGTGISTDGYTLITYQVSGTFVATILPEASLDNVNFNLLTCYQMDGVTVFTSFTTPGTYRCNLSGQNVARARISAYTSGSVTVNVSIVAGGSVQNFGERIVSNPILTPVINVRAPPYNAKGDGTDATTAWQSAIDAAAGSTVICPDGIYLISSALRIKNHNTHILGPLNWRGQWQGDVGKGCVLKRTTAGPIFDLTVNPDEANSSSIRGISFEGSSTGPYIQLENGVNAIIIERNSFSGRDIAIRFGVGNELNRQNVYDVTIKNNMFTNQTVAALAFDSAFGNSIWIEKNYFRNDAGIGGTATRATGALTNYNHVVVDKNTFAGYNGAGITVLGWVPGSPASGTNSIASLSITNNYFENNIGNGSWQSQFNATGANISGNIFLLGGTNVNGITVNGVVANSNILIGTNTFVTVTGTAISITSGTTNTVILPQVGLGATLVDNGTNTINLNSGKISSTLPTGTAPLSVASTTPVSNLSLGGGGTIDNTPIGNTTTSSGKFTTISASGQITSTLATGTAPLSVVSTTPITNLNGYLTAYNAAGTQQVSTYAQYGSVTLSGGTATVTLTHAFAITPFCWANDTTAANLARAVATTVSSVTVTGTTTDVINWICVGT